MIEKLDTKDFDKMFAIMEQSFPPDEYRPFDEQKALFENEEYCVYIERESEVVKGFIAVWEFSEFLFIEHFAVNQKFRNQGVGAGMLSELIALYGKAACLEVEPPEDEITKRRIGFYERNGFFLNEYPYMQPPISAGKNPVPLLLMSSGEALCKEKFAKIREVLCTKVYKCKKPF